jgi:hypothetical protein
MHEVVLNVVEVRCNPNGLKHHLGNELIGRQSEMATALTYVEQIYGAVNQPLVVHGPIGCGLSGFAAHLVDSIRAKGFPSLRFDCC